MQAREARVLLHGANPKLIKCIEGICEELQMQKHTIVELAKLLNRNLDHVAVMQQILKVPAIAKQTQADLDHMRQTHINSPENVEDKVRKQTE